MRNKIINKILENFGNVPYCLTSSHLTSEVIKEFIDDVNDEYPEYVKDPKDPIDKLRLEIGRKQFILDRTTHLKELLKDETDDSLISLFEEMVIARWR